MHFRSSLTSNLAQKCTLEQFESEPGLQCGTCSQISVQYRFSEIYDNVQNCSFGIPSDCSNMHFWSGFESGPKENLKHV